MERQPRRLEREGREDVASALCAYRVQLVAAGVSAVEIEHLVERRCVELTGALETVLAAVRRRF